MEDWIKDNLAWMYWTVPSAVAFIVLFCVLVFMGVWDRVSPAIARKGVLPISTTRGDRLFIVIISAIGIVLLWLGFLGTSALWAAALTALLCSVAIFRWG